jgi:L-fuculose-phosphate aldolase
MYTITKIFEDFNMYKETERQIKDVCLAMFRKDFVGIFHGSISKKLEFNKFVINKKDAIFDDIDKNSLIELYFHKDYRWNDASIDAEIHLNIYQNIHEAKYIAYTMPPYVMAYSLKHNKIIPQDYFGQKLFGEIDIYDPLDYNDWYERADTEIFRYLKESKKSIIVIKGYGVYAYDRDIFQLVKKIAILNKSCNLLLLSNLT